MPEHQHRDKASSKREYTVLYWLKRIPYRIVRILDSFLCFLDAFFYFLAAFFRKLTTRFSQGQPPPP